MQANKIDNFDFKHYLYVIIHSFSHVFEHLASQHQVSAIEWLQPGQLRQIPRHTTDALTIPQTRIQVGQPFRLTLGKAGG